MAEASEVEAVVIGAGLSGLAAARVPHKKLVWCTERVGRVVDFWVAFSEVVVIVRRLVREGWVRYRWDGRPSRRP